MKIQMEEFESRNRGNKCSELKTTICFLSIWRLVAIICSLAAAVCVMLLFKAYIRFVLLWLENQDSVVISVTITVLFVIVSLPISIGYIVLVVAEGYLFGIVKGMFLTVVGANFGLLVAHNVLRLVGHHKSIYKYTQNETAQAIMRVISGPLCFKIVFCSRLTPIPFGLQNAIFALSNVNTSVYHLASLIGLLPAQFVGVYVGTTLRSMQDVLENKHISSTTYLFVTLQLILATFLMVWFSAKARIELLKALAEADNVSSTKVPTYSIV